MRLDVPSRLSHELQDVVNPSGVRQTPKSDTVSDTASSNGVGRWDDGNDGRRKRRDERGRHVPVEDLLAEKEKSTLSRRRMVAFFKVGFMETT